MIAYDFKNRDLELEYVMVFYLDQGLMRRWVKFNFLQLYVRFIRVNLACFFASVYDVFFKIWFINDLLTFGLHLLTLAFRIPRWLIAFASRSVGTPIFVLGLQSGRSPIEFMWYVTTAYIYIRNLKSSLWCKYTWK